MLAGADNMCPTWMHKVRREWRHPRHVLLLTLIILDAFRTAKYLRERLLESINVKTCESRLLLVIEIESKLLLNSCVSVTLLPSVVDARFLVPNFATNAANIVTTRKFPDWNVLQFLLSN